MKFFQILCVLIITFTSSLTAKTIEVYEQQIELAQGLQKTELIVHFLEDYARYSAKKSISYGEQALRYLRDHPQPELEVKVYAYLARSYNFIDNQAESLSLAEHALTLANKINNTNLQILSYKVKGETQLALRLYDNALDNLSLAMDLAEQINDTKLLADLLNDKGNIYRKMAKLDLALREYLTALEIYRFKENKAKIAEAVGAIGSIYRTSGDFEKALKYQLEALMLKQDLGDVRALSLQYNNTAIVYKDIGDYDNAIKLHLKSLELKTQLNYLRGMVFSNNNLGETSRLAGKTEDALMYLNKAKQLADQLGNEELQGSSNLYLGRLFLDQNDLATSEQYLDEALTIFTTTQELSRLAETHLELGRLRFGQGNYDKAVKHVEQSILFADKSEKNVVLLGAYQALSEFNEAMQNYPQALNYFKKYTAKSEEIFSKKAQLSTGALRVEFEVDQKQREIEALKQKNTITHLELTHQASEKNTALLISLLISLAILFSAFLYLKHKKHQAQKTVLAAIKEGKKRLKLALWGSGDELWDWDLITGTISRENTFNNTTLPRDHIGNSMNAMQNVIHPDDFERVKSLFEQHVNNEKTDFFEASYRIKNTFGEWLWVLDRGKVVERDNTGQATRISGTLRDITTLKQQELALIELNSELEQRVEERTKDLQQTNSELSVTLTALTETQTKLVEVEKMASLGSLITGIAHEMNTPIGTCVTASSVLQEIIEDIETRVNTNQLSKERLQNALGQLKNSETLITKNIHKSANLILQFKQIANTNPTTSIFSLSNLLSKKLQLFQNQHVSQVHVRFECQSETTINSFAMSFDMILDILLSNSLQHGCGTERLINILVTLAKNESHLLLTYQDDGIGIEDNVADKIFEPFFTTKRNLGNIGLGLHIFYNQVTQQLKGSIHFQKNHPQGVIFTLSIPL
ncbi:tetratricopeptide repeat protein [Pseudoalteromonas tunicata]|uniref:histidine kinase n=1 Tax=Pseudoalteromonas tunicata D2 TaxID=87626 RepID=A4CDV6_9GAMM|nr:tetratricopeptide repeat protein [Pseudoalteromonas tunicata]ATC96359.1 hypothetical protein PTUN_a4146 [Pseudoalteromonas tunicata]AXT31855.1 PAS domain S-box protein [Pseudoalteromonas tunicata]EAR27148.1 sensory box histidine kinase [Pseudoalteromonas tunicata D2]